MCLAIPAKILKFIDDNTVLADFSQSIKREVSVALIKDKLKEGDYVMVHTGYAINKMSPEEAQEVLSAWEEVWELEKK